MTITQSPDTILADPDRLRAVYESRLLDSIAEEAFDRLTRLAGMVTDSPVSLITVVDSDRQFFKSIFGRLAEPYMSQRQTPLSHSFCKHVVTNGDALIVSDARQHPYLKDNKAISDLGVIGYLGVPLTSIDGQDIGSFCVIDNKPREWTERELEIIQELAVSTMTEIDLRAQIIARELAETEILKRQRQYERVYHFAGSTLRHMKTVVERGADREEVMVYIGDMENQLSRL